MNHSDIAALMKGAAPVIRDYVAASVQPFVDQVALLAKQIDALSLRLDGLPVVDLKPVENSVKTAFDFAMEQASEIRAELETIKAAAPDVPAMIAEAIAGLPVPAEPPALPDVEKMIAEAVAAIPPPAPGKDADPEAVKALVDETVSRIYGPDKEKLQQWGLEIERALAIPHDETIRLAVEKAVAAIPPAEKGKDADSVEVAALVKSEAERILAGWERPQDGKSVTVDDMRPLVDEAVSKAVSAIPVPKDGAPGKDGRDGCDVVDAMQDKDGNLVVSFSDGRMKNVGQVCGKDGLNGTAGKDGRDGFSLENFDAELMKDGRTVLLRFEQGERAFAVELGIPAMIYRGVYREDEEYAKGDTVTFGGSLWHCDAETVKGMKPDAIGEQKSWTLCAKKGRDGKDGIVKAETKPGPVKVG